MWYSPKPHTFSECSVLSILQNNKQKVYYKIMEAAVMDLLMRTTFYLSSTLSHSLYLSRLNL